MTKHSVSIHLSINSLMYGLKFVVLVCITLKFAKTQYTEYYITFQIQSYN